MTPTDGSPLAGWSLQTLALPMRVLLSSFLLTMAFGYLAALVYLFLSDVDPHRQMGMGLVASITTKYYGARNDTRLEASLRGPMADKLPATDRDQILRWLSAGATREGFEAVKPMFTKNCMACHGAAGPSASLAPLTSFEEVTKFAKVDTGPSVAQLARVSHVHLFGISIVFLLTGAIFALSSVPLAWRAVLVGLPYAAMWIDIGSWWVTKYAPAFAYTVIAGGGLMSVAFAVQILVPLWDMWLARQRGAAPRVDAVS